jgi:hypothetical protein
MNLQADPHRKKLSAPVSARRKRLQRGVEVIEFGMFAAMMAPALVWMFTTGMNFLRFNKANDVAHSTALMYMKGTDMTVLGSQEIIARVAQGLDLEVDDGATPPSQALSNSRGSGLVVLTQVQYVGATTCTGCANLNQYVYLQRIYIGNKNLQIAGSTVQSSLGNPPSNLWNSSTGMVSTPYTSTTNQLPGSFAGLWSPALGDGQIVYVVECFFKGNFGTGIFDGDGISTRVFM